MLPRRRAAAGAQSELFVYIFWEGLGGRKKKDMLRYLYIKIVVRFCLTFFKKMGVLSANLFAMSERLG